MKIKKTELERGAKNKKNVLKSKGRYKVFVVFI